MNLFRKMRPRTWAQTRGARQTEAEFDEVGELCCAPRGVGCVVPTGVELGVVSESLRKNQFKYKDIPSLLDSLPGHQTAVQGSPKKS